MVNFIFQNGRQYGRYGILMQLRNFGAVTTCRKEMCWVHEISDAVTTSGDFQCRIFMQGVSDEEL